MTVEESSVRESPAISDLRTNQEHKRVESRAPGRWDATVGPRTKRRQGKVGRNKEGSSERLPLCET